MEANMPFKHPFTQLALKFVYDNPARDAWIRNGTLPAGDYVSPQPGSAQDSALRGDSASAVNTLIDEEYGGSKVASGLVQAVPHIVPNPNWPSRP
jgi:hypothetical protein